MRLSVYTNCYGPAGVWSAVEHVAAIGLDSIEPALRGHNMGGLVIPDSAVITEKTDAATVDRFIAHLKQHRVAISGCNIGGVDPISEQGKSTLIERIRRASEWFACKLAVSGAGSPKTELDRRTLIANLRAIGDVAESLGARLALETHAGPTQNAQAMLELMTELDHPAVRLNFDTGNIAYYNEGLDPVAELAQVTAYVANVHLKDNRGKPRDWYFPAVGDGGGVDFGAVLRVLESSAYSGACTIEIEGIEGEPEPDLQARSDRVSRSVHFLRRLGY